LIIPRGAGVPAEIALKVFAAAMAARAPFEPDPGHAGEGTDATFTPPDARLAFVITGAAADASGVKAVLARRKGGDRKANGEPDE